MELPAPTDDEIRERIGPLRKIHWNRLSDIIRRNGFSHSDFTRKTRGQDSQHDGIVFTVGHHVLFFQIRIADSKSPASSRINYSYLQKPVDASLTLHENVTQISVSTFGDLYKQFPYWLKMLQTSSTLARELEERLQLEESLPDFWEMDDAPPSPSSQSVQLWEQDYKFKEEDVKEFNRRLDTALLSIAQDPTVPEESKQHLQELKNLAPKVGQEWGPWRQIFVGWAVGKVMDHVVAGVVMKVIFDAVSGYLTTQYQMPLPPLLQ